MVRTIRFSDPIFSLALFQLIEMSIRVSNFSEFELKSDQKVVFCEPALRELLKITKVAWS